jgi:hypothetical protein
VWHSYAAANSREQTAARALGRALEGWIRDMDRNREEVDPRLRGLASILKQGYLPTAGDIESSALFNQSYKDGSLDVLIQSIASRVPNTDSVHRTALALSLPYNLQRLNPETRSDVIAALATLPGGTCTSSVFM